MKVLTTGLVAAAAWITAVSAAPGTLSIPPGRMFIPPGTLSIPPGNYPQVYPSQTSSPEEQDEDLKYKKPPKDYDPLKDETDLPVKIIVWTPPPPKYDFGTQKSQSFLIYARSPVHCQMLNNEIATACGGHKDWKETVTTGEDMWNGSWKIKVSGAFKKDMSWNSARSCLEHAVVASGGPALEPEKYGEREEVKFGKHLATVRHGTEPETLSVNVHRIFVTVTRSDPSTTQLSRPHAGVAHAADGESIHAGLALQARDHALSIPPGNSPQVAPSETPLPGKEDPDHERNWFTEGSYDPLTDERNLPVKIIVSKCDPWMLWRPIKALCGQSRNQHDFTIYGRTPMIQPILELEIRETCKLKAHFWERVDIDQCQKANSRECKDLERGNWEFKVHGTFLKGASWSYACGCLEAAVISASGPPLQPELYGECEEVDTGKHIEDYNKKPKIVWAQSGFLGNFTNTHSATTMATPPPPATTKTKSLPATATPTPSTFTTTLGPSVVEVTETVAVSVVIATETPDLGNTSNEIDSEASASVHAASEEDATGDGEGTEAVSNDETKTQAVDDHIFRRAACHTSAFSA